MEDEWCSECDRWVHPDDWDWYQNLCKWCVDELDAEEGL